MTKENSHFINYIREWHRINTMNVIKHIPEEMERRRQYAREYYAKKRLEKQQANQQ
jgi:hypothetical protein